MPVTARHALIMALITLHATVSVCGAGLHSLPGWGHDSGLSPLARNDHSHGPGKTAHEAADECTVCQFLVQGQLPCDLPIAVTSWLTIGLVTPATPDADLVSLHSPSVPRGPPPAPSVA